MLYELIRSLYNFIESNRLISLLISLVSYAAYHLIVYPFFLSPLRTVPGPYIFRISKLPALHYQRTNQWVLLVHNLHKKYGNVVILSPGEISVNEDLKFLNDIYTKNFPKSTFYANFGNHGEPNMFASLENDQHLKFKKNISSIYSKSAIFNPKNSTRKCLMDKVNKLITNIRTSSVDGTRPDYINGESEVNIHGKGYDADDKKWFMKGKKANLGIEVYSLFGSLALDVVSSFELGDNNGTDLLTHPDKRDIVIYHRYVASMGFYTTLMPLLWNYAASKLILKSSEIINNWQLALYSNAERNVPKFNQDENLTTLELLKTCGLKGNRAYLFLSDNIFAGHETTAIQLTYLTYELSRPVNRYLQRMLYQELVDHFGENTDQDQTLDDLETIDKLPILNAIVLETSRVHTSIPGAEPRVVDKLYTIDNTVIPIGTIISAQPYSYHRVASIFPQPDQFRPQRWLKLENETEPEYNLRIKLMNKYMIPFGKGIRMCLGMNIAQIEIKLAVANIYYNFNSKICSNWCDIIDATKLDSDDKLNDIKMGAASVGTNKTDVEKMTMFDTYTTRPFNDECWLEFYKN